MASAMHFVIWEQVDACLDKGGTPMELIHISDKAAFDHLISGSKKPVVVDFWAVWCGPCQMLAPVIEKLAENHEEVQVAKVDVDQVPDVAAQFGISAIPTVIYFKEGKEAARFVGVQPESTYVNAIASL
jgi:thioredoxin 1